MAKPSEFDVFAGIPGAVRIVLMLGGALVSAFSGVLPEAWQLAGFIAGIAAIIVGGLGSLWHLLNERRARQGKSRIGLEPLHIIGLGLLIALGGVGWQIFWGSSSSQLERLQADFDRLVRPRLLRNR